VEVTAASATVSCSKRRL